MLTCSQTRCVSRMLNNKVHIHIAFCCKLQFANCNK
ncbi:Uncharacterised protein [Vibrio cholerae]|nr:Uncharacterised protein [Vibrio cholerae]